MRPILLTLAALGLTACASRDTAPSDETQIAELILNSNAALIAGDVDAATRPFARDFAWRRGGKPEYVDYLDLAVAAGSLQDARLITDELHVTVTNGEATAGPVTLTGEFGRLTLHYTLERRDGAWRVTGLDQSR